jgi:hypothetical protein
MKSYADSDPATQELSTPEGDIGQERVEHGSYEPPRRMVTS